MLSFWDEHIILFFLFRFTKTCFSIYSELLGARGKEALSKEQHFLIKFQQKFESFLSCQKQRLVSDLWRPNQIYQEMLGFQQKNHSGYF